MGMTGSKELGITDGNKPAGMETSILYCSNGVYWSMGELFKVKQIKKPLISLRIC